MLTDADIELAAQRKRNRYYNPNVIGPNGQSPYQVYGEGQVVPPPINPDPTGAQAAGNKTLEQMQAQQQEDVERLRATGMGQEPLTDTRPVVSGMLFAQPSTGVFNGPQGTPSFVSAHTTNDQLAEFARNDVARTRGTAGVGRGGVRAEPLPGTAAYEKNALAEEEKILDIYKKQREVLWSEEDRAANKTILQDKMQLGQVDLYKAQVQAATDAQTYAKNELMNPILKAEAEARLKELDNKNTLTTQEIEQRKQWKAMIDDNRPQPPPPVVQAEGKIMSAQSTAELQVPHYDLYSVAAVHNMPNEVRDTTQLGIWANTYRNPMELAQDAVVDGKHVILDSPYLGTFNNLNKEDQIKVNAAISDHLMPDQALERIIKESGLKPGDTGYQKFVSDFAYGVWKSYKEKGDPALKAFQEIVVQDKAQQAAKVAAQVVPLVQQVASPEIVTAILNSKVKTVEKYLAESEAAKVSGVSGALYAPGLRLSGAGKVGIDPFKAEAMTPEQISQTILTHMIAENKNDVPLVNALSSYMDKANRPEQVQVALDALVMPFNKGFKDAKEAIVKKQVEQKAKEKESETYAKENGFAVEFDPQTHDPVYFLDAAGARAYRNEPSELEKKELADAAGKLTADKLADPNFRRFLTKTPKEQNEVLDDIEGGKLAIEIDDKAFANSSVALKYKALTKEDLRLKLNALAKINGQPEIPAPPPPEPTESWHLSHLWDWIGEKQKPAAPVAATTPAAVTEQPVVAPTPVLTAEEVSKSMPERFKDPVTGKTYVKRSAPSTPTKPTPPAASAQTNPAVAPTAVVTPTPAPAPVLKSAAEIKQAEIDAQNEKTFAARPKPLTREEELDKYKASMGIPTSKEESATAQAKRMDTFKNLTKDLPVNFNMPPGIENAGWYVVKNELIKKFDLGGMTTSQDILPALVDKGLTDKQARQLINARFYLAKQKAKK